MANANDASFLDFASFLKEKPDEAFSEVDQACLSNELFKDARCQRSILPLYFFLTRRAECRMTVRELKKRFSCGAELISEVRTSIVEKKPLKVPGHKKVKPVRNDPRLVELVDSMTRKDGSLSNADLANALMTSKSSVGRIRHDKKFSYRPLRHGPRLEDRHVEARLAFCRAHVNDDWSRTMFTDESRFATSPDCPVKQWIKTGENIYMVSEKFPKSYMVWGGIVGNMKTPLLMCPNRMDAGGYIQLLETGRVVEFLRQNGVAIFQQDGAKCHTAKKTRLWFEGQGVVLLNGWPANSPDLSPIEQIWGIAKRFIIQRYMMRSPLTLEQLRTAMFDAYNNVQPRTIAILTKSVEFRVRLCIERGGQFVGDALEECCRRARMVVDFAVDPETDSIIQLAFHEDERHDEQDEQEHLATLPSFRTYQ